MPTRHGWTVACRLVAALALGAVAAACAAGPEPDAPSPAGRAGQSPVAPAGPSPEGEPAKEGAPVVTAPVVEPSGPFPAAVVTLRTASGEEIPVAAHVAAEPDTRRRGLMHREDVPPGTGMLFLFPEDRTGPFWMKDTFVPLSIAFADAGGRIVRILDMEPCTAEPCRRYSPGTSYRVALEVAQGEFRRSGVREGDVIDLPGDLPPAR